IRPAVRIEICGARFIATVEWYLPHAFGIQSGLAAPINEYRYGFLQHSPDAVTEKCSRRQVLLGRSDCNVGCPGSWEATCAGSKGPASVSVEYEGVPGKRCFD